MTKIWECWDCGHIFENEKNPQICPKCLNLHLMNKESYFMELPQTRKPGQDNKTDDERRFYHTYKIDNK